MGINQGKRVNLYQEKGVLSFHRQYHSTADQIALPVNPVHLRFINLAGSEIQLVRTVAGLPVEIGVARRYADV